MTFHKPSSSSLVLTTLMTCVALWSAPVQGGSVTGDPKLLDAVIAALDRNAPQIRTWAGEAELTSETKAPEGTTTLRVRAKFA